MARRENNQERRMNIVTVVLKLIFLIFSTWIEHKKERKEKMQGAIKEVISGIKDKDASRVTAGFDRINRM